MKKPILLSAILALAVFVLIFLAITRLKKEPPPAQQGGEKPTEKSAVPAPVEKKSLPAAPDAAPVKALVTPAPASKDAPIPSEVAGQVLVEGTLQPLPGSIVRAAIDRGARLDEEPSWLREAIADGSGRFKLEDLPFAPLRIRASSAGHLDAEAAGVFPGDEARLVLTKQDGVPCVVEVDREEGAAPLPRQKVIVAIPEYGWSLEAETDDAGKILLTGIDRVQLELARKDHRVEAAVPGFADANLTAVPPGDSYKLLVEPGAAIEGTVLDARTGKPVPHAMVHAETGHEVEVDERGVYKINGVDEDLTAYAPGYSIQTKELDDHDADDKLRIDFRLERGLTLKGTVMDSNGKPLAGVRVAVAPGAFDLDSSSEKLEARLVEVLSSVSGADGQYRLEGLSRQALGLPGELELEVRPPGALGGFTHGVEIEAERGEVEHDIVLDLQEVLVGSVKDSGGKPVARAGVFVESADEDFTASTGTSLEGKFQLKNLRHGMYRVRVERDGCAVHLLELSVPADALNITLDALAAVEGKVVTEGTAGSVEPLAGLRVTLHVAPGSGPPDAAEVTTDESGRFTIAEVPRGEYVLVVRPGARAEPYSRLARETRKAIEVTEDGWLGEVRYLVLPSGEVALSFAIPDSSGGTTPANGTVRVTVTSFRPAGEHAEATAGAPTHGAAQLVQDARDGFHDRWREGEYRVRCAITIEGKQIVKEEAFTIAAGGRVERTVRFVGGR